MTEPQRPWRTGAAVFALAAIEEEWLGGRDGVTPSRLRETVDEVVVVGRPTQVLPPLPAEDEVHRVDDDPEHAGGGPLVGVLAGLKALRARGLERAYVGCVDAPLLSRAHVDWMLARMLTRRKSD